MSDIKENATTAYTEQRDRAVEMLNALADALRSTGRNLSSQSGTDGQDDKAAMSLAPYIDEAADRLSQSANFLREKEMSGLLHEAQTLAKKQPMLFLGAMFGIGVAGARIIKGMSDGDDSQSRDAEGQSSNGQRDMPESSGGTMADAGGRLGSDWNQSAAARAAGSSTTGASTPEPAASTLSGAYPRSSAGAAESPGERS
jgi:hypothetical protein